MPQGILEAQVWWIPTLCEITPLGKPQKAFHGAGGGDLAGECRGRLGTNGTDLGPCWHMG